MSRVLGDDMDDAVKREVFMTKKMPAWYYKNAQHAKKLKCAIVTMLIPLSDKNKLTLPNLIISSHELQHVMNTMSANPNQMTIIDDDETKFATALYSKKVQLPDLTKIEGHVECNFRQNRYDCLVACEKRKRQKKGSKSKKTSSDDDEDDEEDDEDDVDNDEDDVDGKKKKVVVMENNDKSEAVQEFNIIHDKGSNNVLSRKKQKIDK